MAFKDRIARLRAHAISLANSSISIDKGCLVYGGAILETNLKGNIHLGPFSILHRGAVLQTYGGRITTGSHCTFNPYTVVYGHGGVTIGNNVSIATHSVLVSFNHRFSEPGTAIQRQGVEMRGIEVEDDVWIGAGATILDGVRVGKGSVIAAGAVVTRSTEPFSVYAGVPARRLRSR